MSGSKISTFGFIFSSFIFAACTSDPNSASAVAKVNGKYIPLSSFEAQANRLSEIPGMNMNDPGKKTELLKDLIKQELLYQAALKENLPDRSDRLKREIATEYLNEKLSQASAGVGEKEIKAFYEAHAHEMDAIRASHLLIKPATANDPKSWEAAKARAESVLAKLKAEGAKADFEKYARTYSNDPYTQSHGADLGFFTRDRMVKEFSDAAFALKNVGDLSGIVRSQFGYHIIKLTDDKRGLEQHRQDILANLIREQQKQKAEKIISDLEKKSRVTLYDEVLAGAKLRGSAQKK